jgi:hypothetical protein
MAETLEASLRHPKELQNGARPIPTKNKGFTAANTRTVAKINQQSPPNPIRIGLRWNSKRSRRGFMVGKMAERVGLLRPS